MGQHACQVVGTVYEHERACFSLQEDGHRCPDPSDAAATLCDGTLVCGGAAIKQLAVEVDAVEHASGFYASQCGCAVVYDLAFEGSCSSQ